LKRTVDSELLDRINERAGRGEPFAVVRILGGDNQVVSVYDGELDPPLADQELGAQVLGSVRALTEKARIADLVDVIDEKGSRVTLVIEIIRPELELLIFGGGHVGQAVALIGALTGYRVTVVDDREEFASRQRLPDPAINLVVSDYGSASERVNISTNTAVVIVTRGHQYDELCLKNVIDSSANYIGMIGSRKRVLSVFKKLAGEGVSESALNRVHAPIGLSIGARSPQEIGVAIVAEIINHQNNPGHEYKGE
jgi:xanthine/CO dehydrogenase XdhC/CoxF family maturation factor